MEEIDRETIASENKQRQYIDIKKTIWRQQKDNSERTERHNKDKTGTT